MARQEKEDHSAALDELSHRTVLAKGGLIDITNVMDVGYGVGAAEVIEWTRLVTQNDLHRKSWGRAHANFHRGHSKVFQPKKIVTIGAGADATLVGNLIESYPEAQITAIESDGKKCAAAEERTASRYPDQIGRVRFFKDEAATKLLQLTEAGETFDMTDIQLLLIHLARTAPAFWNPEKQGPFPTLQRVLGAVENSLSGDGRLVVSDLPMHDWHAELDLGQEGNGDAEKAVQAMNYFIHGEGEFPGALSCFRNPWRSITEIAQAVTEFTDLQHLKKHTYRYSVPPARMGDHFERIVTSMAVASLPLGIEGAIKVHEQVLEKIPAESPVYKETLQAYNRLKSIRGPLWERGEKYFNGAKTEGVLTITPDLAFQVFKKAAF